jgi:translation elongation factor P/translation initiation factor 5A
MVLKLIDATQAKPGTTIMVEGAPYTVRTNDKSKTGKHGAATKDLTSH